MHTWRGEVNIRCLLLLPALYFEDRSPTVPETLLFWLEKLARSLKDVFCHTPVLRIEACVSVGFSMDAGVLNSSPHPYLADIFSTELSPQPSVHT